MKCETSKSRKENDGGEGQCCKDKVDGCVVFVGVGELGSDERNLSGTSEDRNEGSRRLRCVLVRILVGRAVQRFSVVLSLLSEQNVY